MKLYRWHKALILTSLVALLLLSVAYNISVVSVRNNGEQFYEVETTMVSEEESQEQEIAQNIETHQAFDQEREELIRELESFKTLEELREETEQRSEAENSSDDPTIGPNESTDIQKEHVVDKKPGLLDNKTDAKESSKEFNMRNSSISYSLVNRTKEHIPPPIYTCMRQGKVVVNIKVNAQGNVVETYINTAASNTTDGCLLDNALSYAKRATFNPISGNGVQLGSITYYFQGK